MQAGNQYLTTLTIYFIGYVSFDVPCNVALRLTSPRFWLLTIALVSVITCTLTGLTRRFTGFLAVCLFLGAAEFGFLPGAALGPRCANGWFVGKFLAQGPIFSRYFQA